MSHLTSQSEPLPNVDEVRDGFAALCVAAGTASLAVGDIRTRGDAIAELGRVYAHRPLPLHLCRSGDAHVTAFRNLAGVLNMTPTMLLACIAEEIGHVRAVARMIEDARRVSTEPPLSGPGELAGCLVFRPRDTAGIVIEAGSRWSRVRRRVRGWIDAIRDAVDRLREGFRRRAEEHARIEAAAWAARLPGDQAWPGDAGVQGRSGGASGGAA